MRFWQTLNLFTMHWRYRHLSARVSKDSNPWRLCCSCCYTHSTHRIEVIHELLEHLFMCWFCQEHHTCVVSCAHGEFIHLSEMRTNSTDLTSAHTPPFSTSPTIFSSQCSFFWPCSAIECLGLLRWVILTESWFQRSHQQMSFWFVKTCVKAF